jgi:cyclopropane-fatty-acyl-phospholipid synthase
MSVTKNRTNGDRPGEEMQSNKIPPAGAGLAGGRAARPTGTTTVTDRDEGERVTRAHAAPSAGGRRRPAAELVTPLLNRLFPRGVPIRFVFWDGSSVGPEDGPGGVTLHTPSALTRLLWAPGELGIARAFVAGDIDANGNAFEVLRLMHSALNQELGTGVGDLGTIGAVIRTAARLGVLGRPPEPPPETRRRGISRPSRTTTTSATSSTGSSSAPR